MLLPRSLFNLTATTDIYTLSLHDALPIWFMATGIAVADADDFSGTVHGKTNEVAGGRDEAALAVGDRNGDDAEVFAIGVDVRSEEHTSELQSHSDLVCRLLLEKKKQSRHT